MQHTPTYGKQGTCSNCSNMQYLHNARMGSRLYRGRTQPVCAGVSTPHPTRLGKLSAAGAEELFQSRVQGHTGVSSVDLLGSSWDNEVLPTMLTAPTISTRYASGAAIPLRSVHHGSAAVRGGPKPEMQDRHVALTHFMPHAIAALFPSASNQHTTPGAGAAERPAQAAPRIHARVGKVWAYDPSSAPDAPAPRLPADPPRGPPTPGDHDARTANWFNATAAAADAAFSVEEQPHGHAPVHAPHVVAAARVTAMPPPGTSPTARLFESAEELANNIAAGAKRVNNPLLELLTSMPTSFAAVFDGHSGSRTSTRAAERLQQLLAGHLGLWAAAAPAGLTTEVEVAEEEAVAAAFSEAFEELDAELLEIARSGGPQCIDGSTALAGLQVGLKLYVANAGDCRAVLGRAGRAMQLSFDHKPNLASERARIEAVGGIVHQVRGVWRIVRPLGPGLGAKVCAVSRGLGDLDFKEPAPLISPAPDVTATALQPGIDTCVVYGSDGLWGAVSDQEAVDLVTRVVADVRAANSGSVTHAVLAAAAARALVRLAQDRGSCDDITALVTLFDWATEGGDDGFGVSGHTRVPASTGYSYQYLEPVVGDVGEAVSRDRPGAAFA